VRSTGISSHGFIGFTGLLTHSSIPSQWGVTSESILDQSGQLFIPFGNCSWKVLNNAVTKDAQFSWLQSMGTPLLIVICIKFADTCLFCTASALCESSHPNHSMHAQNLPRHRIAGGQVTPQGVCVQRCSLGVVHNSIFPKQTRKKRLSESCLFLNKPVGPSHSIHTENQPRNHSAGVSDMP